MTRRILLSLLLLALPALCVAQEKKPKPSYVGVMIAEGEKKGTLVVLSVIKDGPADKAGLKAGDVVLKIDGAVPPDLPTAVKVIGALKAGRKAKFVVRRDDKESEIDVVPVERGG